ncbi:hypothetical protein BH11MYX2_BH11MYX2_07370 [soil metagenome]
MRALALIAILLAHAQPVAADRVLIESYTNTRPDDASQLLAPIVAALADQGISVPENYAPSYEARVSRPTLAPKGLPADFEAAVERGHRAWIAGRFAEAVATLQPLVDAAHANALSVATNQVIRTKLLKASSALALSQQRLGDLTNAKETIREILRSYPDAQFSRATYGPDAYQLFEQVRRDVGTQGHGRLDVEVSANQTVVFVDERFENVGKLHKGEMQPGTYRIFAQLGRDTSRVHLVTVKPDEEAKLSIDPEYDRTVYTSQKWAGLLFGSLTLRREHERAYAARIGKELDASAVIMLGLDVVDSRSAIVGSVIDPATARVVKSSSIALFPAPSPEKLRALAQFLAGSAEAPASESAAPALTATSPVQPVQNDGPSGAMRQGRSWTLWTGVGAIGIGLVGGGLTYKFSRDANDAGDELKTTCAVSCTSEQVTDLQAKQDSANRHALIAGVAGGAAVVTGVVLVILSRRRVGSSSPRVSFAHGAGGAQASVTLSF